MKKPIAKLKLRVETIRSLTAKEQMLVIAGMDDAPTQGVTLCPTGKAL